MTTVVALAVLALCCINMGEGEGRPAKRTARLTTDLVSCGVSCGEQKVVEAEGALYAAQRAFETDLGDAAQFSAKRARFDRACSVLGAFRSDDLPEVAFFL